jgi:indoleamine 2,3-dioxygenase
MSVNLNLKEFGISCRNGFLPENPPLHRLPGTYYNLWESIINRLPRLLTNGQLRAEIDGLPILSVSYLKSEREWQRGYSVLCFLTHAYIWGGSLPKEVSNLVTI